MDSPMLLIIGFNVFVLVMLAMDLGVLHAKREAIPPRQAMIMCFGYMVLAAVFGAGVIHFAGEQKGYEFFAGYIIEQSLSVDNMFVFLLIFTHFKIAPQHQHRVLFYGVLGALAMRGLFIYAGVTLVHMSHWVLAVFGAFLLMTSVKMLIAIEQEPDIENNRILMFARNRLRMTDHSRDGRFFVRKGRFLYATPLFLVLILVETTDIVFAFDSIPAIFAVTQDPFIIYTSNVFAILGLRALYFALAGAMNNFHYLKYGVSLTLMAIGTKMTYASVMGEELMNTQAALALTGFLILGSIAFSMAMRRLRPVEEAAIAAAPPTGWVIGSPLKEKKSDEDDKGLSPAAGGAQGAEVRVLKAKAAPQSKAGKKADRGNRRARGSGRRGR